MSTFIMDHGEANLCLCWDFKSVHSTEERKGRVSVFRQSDADSLTFFNDDCFLVDLPICRRLFIWYRGDGVTMSCLDKFLLSGNWCSVWPNCIQVAYERSISNHVPLVLNVEDENWGPRPIRMLKCWDDFQGYA